MTHRGFFAGINYLSPQETYQSDKQFRYDGSWTKGQHNFRFGAGFNRILGGGLADFFGLAPRVRIDGTTQLGPDASNPLDYGAFRVVLGNGQGFFTEKPGFGYPAGGQGDWRTFAYVCGFLEDSSGLYPQLRPPLVARYRPLGLRPGAHSLLGGRYLAHWLQPLRLAV